MMSTPTQHFPKTNTSQQECVAGFMASLPATMSLAPFALLLGALAADKGLSTLESTLMSVMVFAGSAQYAAVDTWQSPPMLWSLAIATLVINMRHVFMSASIRRHMGKFPKLAKVISLLFLADEIWAFAELRATHHRLTPCYFAGLVVPFYSCWVIFTMLGAELGSMVKDPTQYGFDFAFVAIFITLIMGFRDRSGFFPTLITSAVVATLVNQIFPGPASIASGAIAGVIAAGITHTPQKKA